MNIKSLILALAVLGLFGGVVLAQQTQNNKDVQVVTATTPISNAVEVGNKICPVDGNKIPVSGKMGAMGGPVKVMYKGKIYNLDCPMCIQEFKNNPEKYSAIADKER